MDVDNIKTNAHLEYLTELINNDSVSLFRDYLDENNEPD